MLGGLCWKNQIQTNQIVLGEERVGGKLWVENGRGLLLEFARELYEELLAPVLIY